MSRFSTNSISSTFLTSSVAVSISVNSLRESEIAQGLPKTILLGRFGSKPSEEFLGRIATALRAHVLRESLTDPSATPQTTAHRSMLSMVIRRRGIGNQSIRNTLPALLSNKRYRPSYDQAILHGRTDSGRPSRKKNLHTALKPTTTYTADTFARMSIPLSPAARPYNRPRRRPRRTRPSASSTTHTVTTLWSTPFSSLQQPPRVSVVRKQPHLVNGDLVQPLKPVRLRDTVLDHHGVQVLHVRKAD